jgi:hypothetical protein
MNYRCHVTGCSFQCDSITELIRHVREVGHDDLADALHDATKHATPTPVEVGPPNDLRDRFAVNAPLNIPSWFKPWMELPPPDKPGTKPLARPVVDDKTMQVTHPGLAKWHAEQEAYNAYQVRYEQQKVAQWPWAYADLVMQAREKA